MDGLTIDTKTGLAYWVGSNDLATIAAQFSTTVVAPRVDTGAWNLMGVYSR